MPSLEDLCSWHIISLLGDDFLRSLSWVYVFGNSGNEVIMSTREDEVYVLGANTNCCLGMTKSSQVGLEPKRLEKLCGKHVFSVSTGSGPHVLALTSAGDIYSWGHNGYGQLGHGETSIHTRVPTVIVNGLGGVTVKQVACGSYHSMALSKDGQVFTWGFNNCGQLGQGDVSSRYSPIKVSGLLEGEECRMITCGYSSSYALTNGGKVYSWGQNVCGQLGLGSIDQHVQPCLVIPLLKSSIEKIVSGYSHVLALSSSGDVLTWGANTHGQLGNGMKINQPLPFAVGKEIGRFVEIGASNLCHISAAECTNGKILMWGECCHQNVTTPLETELNSVDEVFAKFASPNCSFQAFRVDSEIKRHDSVSQSIENRFNDPDTADLTFIVEGQSIFVHKAILRMRSSYFYSMLKIGNWMEGKMDSVEITNHSAKTYHSFLKYLYTDRIDSTQDEIPSLLELADLYCEFSLKEQCSRLLCRQVNDENALSLYLLSIQYKLKELEESSFCYALRHSNAVVMSDTFLQMDGDFAKQFVLKLAENGAFKT